MWEKALHQWASARERQFTSYAGAVADEHIMCAINVVPLADSEKPQLLDGTNGEQKLYKDKESAKALSLTI